MCQVGWIHVSGGLCFLGWVGCVRCVEVGCIGSDGVGRNGMR